MTETEIKWDMSEEKHKRGRKEFLGMGNTYMENMENSFDEIY